MASGTTAFEESLALLQAMGINRSDAIDCLKACNNDPNTAAEYYWNGDLAKARDSVRWDDSAWSQPREGAQTPAQDHSYSNNWMPSFQIQGPDVPQSSTLEGLKSRPPSRVSMHPTLGNQDQELAQALHNSMNDMSNTGPLETGITGTRNSPVYSHFGPALPNKDYDPSSWALTTTQAQEIIPEPPAADRQRAAGKPAFLRPSCSPLLAGAITVMHAIPGVRSAFLALDHAQDDYGSHDKWWNGESISVSRIINLDGGINEQGLDFLAELQRLMVFLDQTERAYGSADNVIRYADYSENDFNTMTVVSFLEAWDAARKSAYPQDNYKYPFRNIAHHREPDGSVTDHEFISLEMKTTSDDETLYAVIDKLLWGAEGEAYIDFADVICLRITPDIGNSAIGISCPLCLYPDRYTHAWLEVATFLRGEIEKMKAILVELDSQLEMMTKFQKKNAMGQLEGKVFDPRELLKISIEHFASSGTQVTGEDGEKSPPPVSDVTEKLKGILEKLERKLEDLESRRQQAKQALSDLQASYTDPETCDKTLTRYSLRGASLSQNKLYILLPVQSTDTEPSETITPEGEQWWRFDWSQITSSGGWDNTPSVHFSIDKVPANEVVEAISASDSAMVFYANDAALKIPDMEAGKSIPEPLQKFINQDNAFFRSELTPASQIAPGSPEKKRRHSTWLESELTDSEPTPYQFNNLPSESPKRNSLSRPRSNPEALGGVDPTVSSDPILSSSPPSQVGGLPPLPGYEYASSFSNKFEGGNIVEHTLEIPQMQEMRERGGHVSPIAQVFHHDRMRRKGRVSSSASGAVSATGGPIGRGMDMSGNPTSPDMPDSDFEMPDAEHVEYAAKTGAVGEGRRKGG